MIFSVLFIAFLGLLILVLVLSWLPLIEFWTEQDPVKKHLIVSNLGGSHTRHFQSQENRIWVAFLLGMISYVTCIIVFATYLPPDALLKTLGSYALALLGILILSPMMVLWMDQFLGKGNSGAEGAKELAFGCLICFQVRGWIVLLLFLLLLVLDPTNS